MLIEHSQLTGVVLTNNEEVDLEKCLKSLQFCDSILVIDDNSQDKTPTIAKSLKSKVLIHPLNNDFSSQRNWAIEQATTPWILFIDADEVVSPQLQTEILNDIKSPSFVGYKIPRKDFLWGQRLDHGDLNNIKLIRLFRRGMGKWVGKVHEVLKVEGRVGELTNPIVHTPHPKIVDFLNHLNYYSSIRAQEFYAQGKKSSLLKIIFAPLVRFIHYYVLKMGFLDKTAGFVHAMLMSFYAFLVAGKLYLLEKGIPKVSPYESK
jgi:glycosyltransferase involved in cell wall biosynthesis